MSRLICIGDVHGCLAELDALLELLELRPGDRVAFVGDLVDRGPDTLGVLRRARELLARYPGSAVVAGNHEEKALRDHDRERPGEHPWIADASDEDWAFLDGLPLLWRDPELGVVVVHGGFYPAFFEIYGEIGELTPEWRRKKDKRSKRMTRFLRVRTVSETGHMVSLSDARPEQSHWSALYDGREGFCYFGHDPQLEPPVVLRAPHAMGLDTGCCFGGTLTAAVVTTDPAQPELVSVPAYAQYAQPLKRPS